VLAAIYWILSKRREKPKDWYDEKQFADVSRGALMTLVITVLSTLVFYFLISCDILCADMLIWFPSYLFLTLFVFSICTLFLSKKA
jgi:cobalamin biosynthesis protein CobD/CbiB